MGFERFHKGFNPTHTGDDTTHNGLKKYHTPLSASPMSCINDRKVSNTCHTPLKHNHNGPIASHTRPFATHSGTSNGHKRRLTVATGKFAAA